MKRTPVLLFPISISAVFLSIFTTGCHSSKSPQKSQGPSLASCGDTKKLGRAARQVCLLLHHQDPARRKAGAEALGEMGRTEFEAKLTMKHRPDPDVYVMAIPALIQALADQDKQVRQASLQALERMGDRAAPAVPSLVKILQTDMKLAPFAANTLGAIGPRASAAIPALAGKMKKKDLEHRFLFANALGRIGPGALPVLTGALKEPDNKTKELATDALALIGVKAAPALTELAALVTHQDTNVRLSALSALARVCSTGSGMFKKTGLCHKQESGKLTSVILKALADSSPDVRTAAAQCVGDLGMVDRAMIPPLTKILSQHPDAKGRRSAAESLGWMGPEAAGAGHVLVGALSDPERIVRIYAAWALGRIGSEARLAVDALLKRARSSTGPEREAHIEALGRIGTAAAPAYPFVLELFNGEDERLARLAATVLPRISAKGMPFIVQGLDSKDKRVRQNCARALGTLGPQAASAIPSLKKSLKDKDSDVRHEAKLALEEISEQ